MNNERFTRLFSLLETSGFDAMVLIPSPILTYLIGIPDHNSERPHVLILRKNIEPVMVLPEFEMGMLKSLPVSVKGVSYGENPELWINAFKEACQCAHLDNKKVAVDTQHMRVMEYNFLLKAAPTAQFLPADQELSRFRMIKDENEIACMKKAAEIAQQALTATLPMIHIGVSEREIASELILQLIRHGSEGAGSFDPIIGSGPNGADPHAMVSDRRLVLGDLVVVDWGALYKGYCSDLTRTLAIGAIDPEFQKIADLVIKANAAGKMASCTGDPANRVDQAARKVISEGGYGPLFNHRTGHGLGIEVHEPPYMTAENTLILETGMTHTVEPGIYLPGRGGVRIEDDVVVRPSGGESLSDMPRELIFIN